MTESKKVPLLAELNQLLSSPNVNSGLHGKVATSGVAAAKNKPNNVSIEEGSENSKKGEEDAAILQLLFPTSDLFHDQQQRPPVLSFVDSIIKCLNQLVTSVPADIDSTTEDGRKIGEMFSIKEQQMIIKAVDIVCVLGLSPFLEKGVGLSLQNRSKYSDDICKCLREFSSDVGRVVGQLEKLVKFLSTLLWSESLGFFILNRVLGDYLASLMQLVFSPSCRAILKTKSDAYDRLFCCNELEKLIKTSFKPLLLSELFILQGAMPPREKSRKEVSSEYIGYNHSVIPGAKTIKKLSASPVWLRNACGRVITDTLWTDSKYGVVSLLETLLASDNNFTDSPQSKLDNVKDKANVTAEIVVTIPRHRSRSEYLSLVVPQIWAIFKQISSSVTDLESETTHEQYKKFCVHAFYILFVSHPDMFNEFILPKFDIGNIESLPDPDTNVINIKRVILSTDKLIQYVNWFDLILLESEASKNHDDYVKLLTETSVFTILFDCICQNYRRENSASLSSMTFCRLLRVVQNTLELLSDESRLQFFNGWMSNRHRGCEQNPNWFISFEIKDGAVQGSSETWSNFCVQQYSTGFVAFVSSMFHEQASKIFLNLLKEFFLHNSSQTDNLFASKTESCESTDFDIAGVKFVLERINVSLKLFVFELLVCDHSELLVADAASFLLVSEVIIDSITKNQNFSQHSKTCSFHILQYLFTIMSALTDVKKSLDEKEQNLFLTVASKCERLKNKLEEDLELISECSTSLQECLQAINAFVVKFKTGISIDSSVSTDANGNCSNVVAGVVLTEDEKEFVNAYTLMNDSILPLKAAGMKQVSELVKKGNKYALEKLPQIIESVMRYLDNEDSYLYLSAVVSLANLCHHLPSNQIERLLELYTNKAASSIDEDCVIKVGEALTRFVIMRGEMIVVKKREFVNALLFNCRDDKSDLIRASSMSNLSRLVDTAKYTLQLDVYEVTHMALNVIKLNLIRPIEETTTKEKNENDRDNFDGAVNVDTRKVVTRSAVMLLTSLLVNFVVIGKDFDRTFDGATLREIYQVLSRVYQTESDLTCRLHAQMGLECINDSMKLLWTNSYQSSDNLKIVGLPPLI